MPARKPCIIGNWKMTGSKASIASLVQGITSEFDGLDNINVVVCPPFPYIEQVEKAVAGSGLKVGAQDVCSEPEGAFTGEVSASMLVDLNCPYVILGHSERRQFLQETDELVARKFRAAYDAGLIPILCVGETEVERKQGLTLEIVKRQLRSVTDRVGLSVFKTAMIAYEPVWAIGTGLTATPKQASEVHAFLRNQFATLSDEVRILYGGSVKANNARALFSEQDIDGALVGGASLNAEAFLTICRLASME